MCDVCLQSICPSGCPNSEDEVILTCTACGRGIKVGERYYRYRSRLLVFKICEDCYDEIEEDEAE